MDDAVRTLESEISPLEILQAFAVNLALQRQALAERNWVALSEVVPKLQQSMSLVQAYPGGAAGLRERLASMTSENNEVSSLLEHATSDRLMSAELIRMNIHRLNALKSLFEHGAVDNSDTGQLNAGSPGSILSTRV